MPRRGHTHYFDGRDRHQAADRFADEGVKHLLVADGLERLDVIASSDIIGRLADIRRETAEAIRARERWERDDNASGGSHHPDESGVATANAPTSAVARRTANTLMPLHSVGECNE